MYFISFLSVFFSQAFSWVFSVFNNIIVVRTLGPEGQGVIALIISFSGILATFGNLGLNWSNTYWAARKRALTDTIFSNSMVFSLILMCTVFILLKGPVIDFVNPFIDARFFRIVLLALPFIVFTQLNQSLLLGLGRMVPYNLISVLRLSFLTLGFALFLIILKKSLVSAVWVWFAVCVLVCFLSIYFVLKQLENFRFKADRKIFTDSVRIGVRVFLLGLISLLIMRFDFFILRYFKGVESVGYYSIAVLFTEVLLFIPQILGQLIMPRGSMQDSGSLLLALRVNRIAVSYSLILGVVMVFAMRPILLILFGPLFLIAYKSFVFLIPGIIALNCTSTICSYINGKDGYPAQMILAALTAFVVNVLLDLLLIPKYNINGAAAASSAAYLASTCFCLVYFYYQKKIPVKELLVLQRDDVRALKERFTQLLNKNI